VLQPGGVLRIIVPDIEKCIRAYANSDSLFFSERSKTWKWAANCKTPLIISGYAGANQTLEGFAGHKYGYDLPTLPRYARPGSRKWSAANSCRALTSLRIDEHSHNAIANVNGDYYSLFVEATK
jgi:hypothetical protein